MRWNQWEKSTPSTGIGTERYEVMKNTLCGELLSSQWVGKV